jgi:hypothetical protein
MIKEENNQQYTVGMETIILNNVSVLVNMLLFK